jgi:hypothetical protein
LDSSLEEEITMKYLEGELCPMRIEFYGVNFAEALQGKECCKLFKFYFLVKEYSE